MKYTYSEGATYQSESTPITIAKIPTGDYKIKAVSGDLEGEYAYTTGPGTQEITVIITSEPYNLSLASWSDLSSESGAEVFAKIRLQGVISYGHSSVSKVKLHGTYGWDYNKISYNFEVNPTNPNGEYVIESAPVGSTDGVYSVTFSAYDADGNILQNANIPKQS